MSLLMRERLLWLLRRIVLRYGPNCSSFHADRSNVALLLAQVASNVGWLAAIRLHVIGGAALETFALETSSTALLLFR